MVFIFEAFKQTISPLATDGKTVEHSKLCVAKDNVVEADVDIVAVDVVTVIAVDNNVVDVVDMNNIVVSNDVDVSVVVGVDMNSGVVVDVVGMCVVNDDFDVIVVVAVGVFVDAVLLLLMSVRHVDSELPARSAVKLIIYLLIIIYL